MQRSALCRSRRELSNEYLIAKIGVDTAENEPLEVWGKIFNIIQLCPYRRHVPLVRRLRREDVRRVEAQAEVRDVRQLPAEVAPDALRFELAARPLERLHVCDVLLPGVLPLEVALQLRNLGLKSFWA